MLRALPEPSLALYRDQYRQKLWREQRQLKRLQEALLAAETEGSVNAIRGAFAAPTPTD